MKEFKNGRSKLYAMNGAKLAKIFLKRGINARQFGRELNFHETYFPKCIRKNQIGEKAIGMLMANGIMPSQYDVNMERTVKSKDPVTVADVFDSLPEEDKNKVYSEVEKAVEEANHVDAGVKKNSGRYTWGDEKSPAEKAMNEPGVVKLEFTIDIVKLKAIVKQAVKEAYEEL